MELILADLDTVENRLKKTLTQAKSGDKTFKAQAAFLERIQAVLNDGKPARKVTVDGELEENLLKELCLLTAKPVLYVANVSEDDLPDGNEFVRKLEAAAREQCGRGTSGAASKGRVKGNVHPPRLRRRRRRLRRRPSRRARPYQTHCARRRAPARAPRRQRRATESASAATARR